MKKRAGFNLKHQNDGFLMARSCRSPALRYWGATLGVKGTAQSTLLRQVSDAGPRVSPRCIPGVAHSVKPLPRPGQPCGVKQAFMECGCHCQAHKLVEIKRSGVHYIVSCRPKNEGKSPSYFRDLGSFPFWQL